MDKSSEKSNTYRPLKDIPSYEAGIVQARAMRLVKKLTDSIVKEYAITSTQWLMIGAVYDAGEDGISISALSTVLGTNLPFVTNTANDLERRHILTRTSPEHNARMTLLHVHPDYIARVPEIERTVRQALRDNIYANVSHADLMTYIKVLYAFNDTLGRA